MLDVVRECLENAQAIRLELRTDLTEIDELNGYLAERIARHERMLTYLLAAVAYMAGDEGFKVLFNHFEEQKIDGIGPDPWGTNDDKRVGSGADIDPLGES